MWDTITDGATQIVLICEEEQPKHVFRVTTFDTELQGFIQGYIVVPGTVGWFSFSAAHEVLKGFDDMGKGTGVEVFFYIGHTNDQCGRRNLCSWKHWQMSGIQG